MKKLFQLSFLAVLLNACSSPEKKEQIENSDSNVTTFYSKSVNDTFYVSVSLPGKKNEQKNKIYPVVYILDANLYFDIMATTFKHYVEVGLLPEMILVGVGYKNFQTMDSLRDRDLTFPKAIPEYEMSTSGGGNKFLSFLNTELVPDIDSKYSVDKAHRILMGHSLGGYFTLYALQQSLSNKETIFSSYIAASPSADYNHNYILNELEKLTADQKNSSCYVTFGGLEDAQEPEDSATLKCPVVISKLDAILKKNKVTYRGDIFSSLDHMDTGFPSFVKGLQWSLMSSE